MHAVLSSVCTTLVDLLFEQNEVLELGMFDVYVCFHIYLRMYLLDEASELVVVLGPGKGAHGAAVDACGWGVGG